MGRVAKNPSLAACYAEIAANPGKTYIYVIKRSNGEPFYVGVGQKRRVGCHERESRNTKKHSHKLSIIRGDDVVYEIVSWFDQWAEAAAEEMRLIALYGRRDKGTGILTNLTDGGEGAPGVVRSQDQRRHLSEIKTGVPLSYEHRAALSEAWMTPARIEGIAKTASKLRGRQHTPEHKAKISAALTGIEKSDDTRKKLSDALVGRTFSPETIEKMREAALNIDPSRRNLVGLREWHAENKEQVSKTQKTLWENPEYRELQCVALQAAERDFSFRQEPEYRENLAEKARARWADPEFKARVSAKIRESKAAKKAA